MMDVKILNKLTERFARGSVRLDPNTRQYVSIRPQRDTWLLERIHEQLSKQAESLIGAYLWHCHVPADKEEVLEVSDQFFCDFFAMMARNRQERTPFTKRGRNGRIIQRDIGKVIKITALAYLWNMVRDATKKVKIWRTRSDIVLLDEAIDSYLKFLQANAPGAGDPSNRLLVKNVCRSIETSARKTLGELEPIKALTDAILSAFVRGDIWQTAQYPAPIRSVNGGDVPGGERIPHRPQYAQRRDFHEFAKQFLDGQPLSLAPAKKAGTDEMRGVLALLAEALGQNGKRVVVDALCRKGSELQQQAETPGVASKVLTDRELRRVEYALRRLLVLVFLPNRDPESDFCSSYSKNGFDFPNSTKDQCKSFWAQEIAAAVSADTSLTLPRQRLIIDAVAKKGIFGKYIGLVIEYGALHSTEAARKELFRPSAVGCRALHQLWLLACGAESEVCLPRPFVLTAVLLAENHALEKDDEFQRLVIYDKDGPPEVLLLDVNGRAGGGIAPPPGTGGRNRGPA